MENHRKTDVEHKGSNVNSLDLFPDKSVVAASLSIHRCHSDGVLTDHNGFIQGKIHLVKGKSSSESSMNGNSEADTNIQLDGSDVGNEILDDQRMTNGHATEMEGCIGSDLVRAHNLINGEIDHDETITDNCDIVRPKTWRRRVVEKNMDKVEGGLKRKGRNGENERLNGKMYKLNISNAIGDEQTSDYTYKVCDTHRHETDILYGRTRGGTRNNIVDGMVPNSLICADDRLDSDGSVSENHRQGENIAEDRLQRSTHDQDNEKDTVKEDNIAAEYATETLNPSPVIECHTVLAPLALPENLSDDEAIGTEQLEAVNNSLHIDEGCHGFDEAQACGGCLEASEQSKNGAESVQCRPSDNCAAALQNSVDRTRTADCYKSYSETVMNCYSNYPIEHSHMCQSSHTHSASETDRDSSLDHVLESESPTDNTQPTLNAGSSGHLCDECVGNRLVQPIGQIGNGHSRSESLESIDDIGDFIEADLPPNVERLAFFARGSSTDEDEGCGDEVLQDNMGEDSDNETIDPLGHFRNSNIQHKGNTTRQNDEGASALYSHIGHDFLSNQNEYSISHRNFDCGRSDCNISSVGNMDMSNENNEHFTDFLDSGEESEGENNPLFNQFGVKWNTSDDGARYNSRSSSKGGKNDSSDTRELKGANSSIKDQNGASSSIKGDQNCVSCDRPVDNTSQRIAELGVLVCDRCYSESDVEFEKSDNLVVVRSRTGLPTASCSSSNMRFLRNGGVVSRNQGGLFPQDKLNNFCVEAARHSSSDSDPCERPFLSDSSELVSPDAEASAEMVFPSTSSLSFDGAARSNQYTGGVRLHGSEETGLRGEPGTLRQAMSLDCEGMDEGLFCPFYTRRSRSLDQETSGNFTDRVTNDMPNISVGISNFQDDESNNQQKVFEKQAYNVRIPACTSSDEEENTHVLSDDDEAAARTGDSRVSDRSADNHALTNGESGGREINLCVLQPFGNDLGFDGRQRNRNVVDEEPIYEDIDDLELLLEEACANGEPTIRETARPLCTALSKLRRKRRHRSPVSSVEKVMIWNEYEAYVVQVKQIGTSACGPTAVLNVLKAFDFQVEKEEVGQTIVSNLRMEAAPIPYYLFSRFAAGTTAQALVEGVATITRGAIKGRFFHFYPQRDVELLKWLGYWMKKGAVPVATLNLQRGVKPGWTIPDAWHHQMVYGVSSKGVYLTNPLEIVPESVILEQLTSDSVLLVRRQDVVSRFRDWCPLNEILKQRDTRWRTMNVLGQIVHMLREQCRPQEPGATTRGQLTSHIQIPAAYKAGIILYMRVNSDAYEELLATPELPLKQPHGGQAESSNTDGLMHGGQADSSNTDGLMHGGQADSSNTDGLMHGEQTESSNTDGLMHGEQAESSDSDGLLYEIDEQVLPASHGTSHKMDES